MKRKTLSLPITLLLLHLFYAKPVLGDTVSMGMIEGAGGYLPKPSTKGDIGTLEAILSTVIGVLTIFAGLYFLITFIVGGISWSTSGGDTNKVESAKKKMTNAALGLIIVVASYAITYIIGQVIGLDILNLSVTYDKLFS